MDFANVPSILPESAVGNRHVDQSPSGGSVSRETVRTAIASIEQSSASVGSRKIRKPDVLMLTSQLAIMCESGLDLAEALKAATDDCKHIELRRVLEAVYRDVANGSPISQALAKHRKVFGDAYIASIAAAEQSGTMSTVLGRLADLLRNEIRLRSSIVSVLIYPIALTAVTSVVLLALVFFVLPQFGTVFTNMNKQPPPVTQILLDGASFMRSHVILIGIASFAAVIAMVLFMKTPGARRYYDGVVLNFVLFRQASRALLAGRSFRLLGTMLQSGVPLLDAVRLCGGTTGNVYFRGLFEAMEHGITNGNGIGDSVRSSEFLPDGIAQMVTTAERTGRLGVVLEMVGEYYEEDGEQRLRQVVKILEPAIIIVMGVVVAGVVLSVMLPLLDVTTMSR